MKGNGFTRSVAATAIKVVGDFDWHGFDADGMAVAIVDITPELATAWLSRNAENNRRYSTIRIAALKRELAAGHWRLTHQGIAFDAAGTLLDGQHRLHAIASGDVSVRLPVWFGLGSIECVDTNYVRTLGQIRRMQGKESDTKYISVVSTLYRIDVDDYTTKLSAQEFEDIEQAYPVEIEWIRSITLGRRLTSAEYAAFAYCYPIAPEPIGRFLEQVITGANLPEGSNALSYIRFVTSPNRNTAGSQNSQRLVQVACGTIRKELEGRKMHFTRPAEEHTQWARLQREAVKSNRPHMSAKPALFPRHA